MTGNVTVGIVGVAIAASLWGSCFVVCKGYEMPQDGVHFAFLMSIGILFVGILALLSSPMEDGDYEALFSPDGLLGGTLWACGNFLTVPIIESIGLGIGLAIWAGVNMIVAFVVGAMGMEALGVPLPKEPLTRPICGVIGVFLACCALFIFTNIKSETGQSTSSADEAPVGHQEEEEEEEEGLPLEGEQDHSTAALQPLLETHAEVSAPSSESNGDVENTTGISNNNNTSSADQRGIKGNVPLGVALAVLAGCFYGFFMVPLAIWNNKVNNNGHIFDHPLPSSDPIRAIRFFFSQFAGIFLTALTGFVAYCLYTKNQPKLVPPEATLPSIVCGSLWAVGCAGGMLATSELGNSVGFPLVLNFSFLINSAWSILVFKEIQGKRNLHLFGAAFLLNFLSSLMISISKAS